MRAIALLALVVLSGCPFDTGFGGKPMIACAGDADCPTGRICSLDDRLCVPREPGPPLALEVTLPGAARGGQVVELRVQADLPIVALELKFAPSDPGFSSGSLNGPVATFTLTVPLDDDQLADGFYLLTAVAVEYEYGVRRSWPQNLALYIDRTRPEIAVVARHETTPAFADLPFSDVAGTDRLLLDYSASELVGAVAIELQGAQLDQIACVQAGADADGRAAAGRCTVTITGGDPSLTSTHLVASALDAAGNLGTGRNSQPVDFRPPAIAAASFRITRSNGQLEGVAAPGDHVAVELLVSEPLLQVSDPHFHVATPAGPIAIENISPFVWRASFDVSNAIDRETSAPLALTLVDRVGHVAVVETANDVTFAPVRVSPCVPPAQLGPCVDVDGDGQSARTAACPSGTDCDDNNFYVYAGAIEIPGDGVGNDCSGAPDLAIDDSSGRFVAPTPVGNNLVGCGTAAQPCNTIDYAVSQLPVGSDYLFLAPGSYVVPQFGLLARIVGGIVAQSLGETIPTPRNEVQPTSVLLLAQTLYYDGDLLFGVLVDNDVETNGTTPITIARSRLHGYIRARRSSNLLESTVTDSVDTFLGTSRIVESSVDGWLGVQSPLTVVRSQIGGTVLLDSDSRVDLVSSLILGSLTCVSCTRIGLYHSTLLGQDSRTAVHTSVPTVVDLVNSVVAVSNLVYEPSMEAVLLDLASGSRLRALGNQFATGRPSSRLLQTGIVSMRLDATDLATFNTLDTEFSPSSSGDCGGNVIGTAPFVDRTANYVGGASAPHGTALPAIDPAAAASVPTGVASDYFGHCRGDAALIGDDTSEAVDIW